MKRSVKREFVRESLWRVAINLFTEKGFDATTVEDISEAAGVSRRSFFRYFESKDDLLAQTAVGYGEALRHSIESAPADLGPGDLILATVRVGLELAAANESRTRQIIDLAIRSDSARRAYQSREGSTENTLAAAYASRGGGKPVSVAESRLLAGVTLSVMNATFASWFAGESPDLQSAAGEVLRLLKGKISSIDM